VKLYGRRFTIEETFRDSKDLKFGMGLSSTHIKSAARRDRMLMLVAVAHTLLTLLGAACEQTGLDRKLKANTSTKRTHSLYRQGLYWYGCLPTMRDAWFDPLFAAFDQIVKEHPYISWLFAQLGPQPANKKCEDASGVKGVANLITVKPKVLPSDLKNKIESALTRSVKADAENIQVEVNGGNVILKGKVRSYMEKREAEHAAWLAPGVTSVDSRIQITYS